jgi:hypothetical protein
LSIERRWQQHGEVCSKIVNALVAKGPSLNNNRVFHPAAVGRWYSSIRRGNRRENAGSELRPKGQPAPVRVRDFAIPELGKAVPHGVYDVSANAGFVNVGISADAGEFSVASIRGWWHEIGAARYPDARQS